jgi:hypothetical protein
MTTDRLGLYDGGSGRPKIIDPHTSRSPGSWLALHALPIRTDHDLRLPY